MCVFKGTVLGTLPVAVEPKAYQGVILGFRYLLTVLPKVRLEDHIKTLIPAQNKL